MADIVLGGSRVTIVNQPKPVFTVTKPESINIVLPVQGPSGPTGPQGPPGSGGGGGGVDDTTIAELITNEASQTHGALIPVIETTVEPSINLNILFENSLA